MAPAASMTGARTASAKLRPPLPSSSSSHAASRSTASQASIPPVPLLPLELPPSLPSLLELQQQSHSLPSASLVSERLASVAHSYISLCSSTDSRDLLSWEVDLCSATFFASYAVCLDPSSVKARRMLARCARLGGFNIVLPMSPSGSASSATLSAAKLNSFDNQDQAGAQACIHILQQGPSATFEDPGCAKEYREACRLLGRNADALQVSDLLTEKVQGKRKALDSPDVARYVPELVSQEARYRSQLTTDDAFGFSRRNQVDVAEAHFRQALSQDPLNWRAWAGLCDVISSTTAASQAFTRETLDKLYAHLEQDVLAPYLEAEAELTSVSAPTSSDMARVISEDGMNKKLKVASDRPPTLATAQRKPAGQVSAATPTTAQTTVTATRLHPTSRALSAAQTNTTQTQNAQADDVKATIKPMPEAPRIARVGSARAGAPGSASAAGRQLRSTATRGQEPAAASRSNVSVPSTRSGATSQAGSVSSTSSGSTVTSATSRDTVRAAVSGRRTPGPSSTASSQSRSISGKLATSTVRSSAPVPSTTARTPSSTRPAPGSRPTSALSRNSSSSASTARPNGASANNAALRSTSAAQQPTAADRQAAANASASRVKLERLVQLRETCLEKLKTLAHYHSIDMYIVGLLHQVGEAYRLLRLCQGDMSAQALKQPVLAATLAKPQLEDEDEAKEGASTDLMSRVREHTAQALDPYVQDSILHHLLLARAYTECSQYSPAELHFAQVRSLNPFVTAHMDVFSVVLFHLAREVTLSALAQHLALVLPASASTQIVIGNAFSLQKEHQTALVCFQRAAAAAPDYAYAYTLAGHEAYDLGLLDEAIAYFRSAIRCDRRHWHGWAGLGRVFLEIGDHEHAACKSFQMAIEINSINYVLWDLVGYTFSLINAPVKALECYDRAIELAPRASVLTYLRKAELLSNDGQHEMAHHNLVLAHDLAPEEASIHILLAQSYMRLGGGEFCHLEKPASSSSMAHKTGAGSSAAATIPLRASGVMVHPRDYQAEISHHLAVAIDLDPTLLRVVKSICEGHKTLPGGGGAGVGGSAGGGMHAYHRRQQYDPHDMASLQDIHATTTSFTRSEMEHGSLADEDVSQPHYYDHSVTSGYSAPVSAAHPSQQHQHAYRSSPQQLSHLVTPHVGMSTPHMHPYHHRHNPTTPAGAPATAAAADPAAVAANSSIMSFSSSTSDLPSHHQHRILPDAYAHPHTH